MNPRNNRQLAALLTAETPPGPPPGLAERIKAEIPRELPLPGAPIGTPSAERERRGWGSPHRRLLAAAVVTCLGGLLAVVYLYRPPRPAVYVHEDRLTVAPVSTYAGTDQTTASAAPESVPAPPLSPEERVMQLKERLRELSKQPDATSRPRSSAPSTAPPPPPPPLRLRGGSVEPPSAPVEPRAESLSETVEALRRQRLGTDAASESKKAAPQASYKDEIEVTAETPPVSSTASQSATVETAETPMALPGTGPVVVDRGADGEMRIRGETTRPVWVGTEADMTFRGGSPRSESGDEDSEVRKRVPEELSRRLRELPREPVSGLDLSPAEPPPSTGGTAEPNDAPYGDVFFKGYGTNPFIDTEDDRLSTFGLDVDTASYGVVRRFLADGHLPPGDAVRVEEIVNAIDYGDPPANGEDDFGIRAELAPSPFGEGPGYSLLRFHLAAREVPTRKRPPADLVFVVDVSGSMERENRLELVKQALSLLIAGLRRDDRVGLVVYGDRGEVLLEPTSDRRAIRQALQRLQPGGSTNAEEGLALGYDLAAHNLRPGAIHRLILCSDGVANVGNTGAASILETVRADAARGIELTTVGFGMGNYNDVLMEQLADRGNGRYAYVDTVEEARRIFVEELTGTLLTVAREARVQVELNPQLVSRYRLLGYENRDIADQRFRDDTVDAGEVGAGHAVTALYEVKLRREPEEDEELATLSLRYASTRLGRVVEQQRRVTGADLAPSWEAASRQLRLTSLVAELAEILKGTYWARSGDLDEVFRRAQGVSAEYPGDRRVADFVSLVGRAASLEERRSGDDG